jgi:outer membrane protein assembly factor BamB
VAPAGSLPEKLGGDGGAAVAWAVDLPGEGLSSPLVVGDKVVVTCSSGAEQDRLHVFCLSAADGSVVWERRFGATGRTMHHEQTSVAAPTPCSDGEQVYALFSSNDLVCLGLDGSVRWLRGLTVDYPNASNSLGLASSPVLAGGILVCLVENDSESFAVGIDTADGTNLWKTDRPKRANWTTPVVIDRLDGAGQLVALQGSAGLDAVDPRSGQTAWSYSEGASTIPSSAAAGGVLYVPSHGLTALVPGDGGFKMKWRQSNLGPGTASPVADADRVYVISNAGVLTAANAADGEQLWRTRLEGPFGGSPVLAGHLLLAVNERSGLAQLVDLRGEEGKVVGTLELGEPIQCTPAASEGAVYVRSDSKLWKIAGG